MRRILCAVAALALVVPAAASAEKASHAGWPSITGELLINKLDQARPLDGRPGSDPFDGSDSSVPCPGGQLHSHCVVGGIPLHGPVTCSKLLSTEAALAAQLRTTAPVLACTRTLSSAAIVPVGVGSNELLGGHGSDTLHAGPHGDVIWGDYKATGQSYSQIDHIWGGAGNDFLYVSHGTNYVHTGGGTDVVHAHFGRGAISCESPNVIVYLSHRSSHLYKLHGCHDLRYKTPQ
ncbi:MAG: calcium-binding protein [Solirubrobacteraceae bacterium]